MEPLEFNDIAQLEAQLSPSHAGCIILDLRLPRLGGIPAVRHVCSQFPKMAVIAISGYADARTVVRALRAGAVDFFDKPFSNQEFLESVQEAMSDTRGGPHPTYWSHSQASRANLELLARSLTRKQRLVLSHFGAGLDEDRIAEEVGLHPRSVRRHIQNGLQKLGLGRSDRSAIASLLPSG